MSEEIEKDLYLNFKDFLKSGNDELEKKRYNPAVSSYFKSLVILCDLKIYKERGLLPKNHSERFLFLKTHFQDIYKLLSPLFKDYRDSYNLRLTKEDASKLKENVKKIQRIFEIKE
ncbi:hypothetical protein HQ529_06495 [Candidatus Woesearchaeota archaeon]|nr:hypothetical protein [Candidatus Woesearchaeota archaeon]